MEVQHKKELTKNGSSLDLKTENKTRII